MTFDELMMKRCLALASFGASHVQPNPMVGAVLVHGDQVIGEGFHEIYGGNHAEVNAFHSVSDQNRSLIRDAVLYVSLEPCNHTGKTPPCSDLIIRNGVKKIVIGAVDSNPNVAGGGIHKLKAHGVEIITDILEKECRALNAVYFTHVEKQRPFITLKWAQSADGFIAGENGKPVHFTNHSSDILVHKWRSEHMGILVGMNTVLNDDPLLTVRRWPGKNPARIILNTGEDFTKKKYKIFNDFSDTYIINFHKNETEGHVHFIRIAPEQSVPVQVIQTLHTLGFSSVLIEGGAKTLQMFIDAGLWDQAKIFISADMLSNGISAPAIPGNIVSTEDIAGQLLITALPA